MQGPRRSRWRSPWVPIALASAIVLGALGILLVGPGRQAQGADPSPQATAGFQTTEKLVLTVQMPAVEGAQAAHKLTVELLDTDSKVLDSSEREVRPEAEATSHRFEFAAPRGSADKITVRCRFASQTVEVPLGKILLAKAHETALSTGQEFFAGSTAAIRCEVHGVKSVSQTVPLPGATVSVSLKAKDGKVRPLFEGKAGADGVADAQFKVPADLPAGSYKMQVVTRSTLGEEKLERDVGVKDAPRVLLVTDKPLYQPGQLMHIRALALQAFDLSPVANSKLLFEVEDSKGNKVFKREQKTSEYGIAAIDFQLASEVNQGDYHVRAILGDKTADKTVSVKPYVLPKFKSDLKADKRYYLPKETLHADLQVDYFFGKPVAGGKVKVTASTFDVAFKDFLTWEGKTDEHGHVKFDVKLPNYFVGQPLQKGNALVRLEVKVTDTADHTETINKTYPVSAQPIQVSLIAESGRLVPNMENRIFAAAVYPDGSPAKCAVEVWLGRVPGKEKPLAALKTGESGLAEFRFTPKPEQFRQEGWAQRTIEMAGGQNVVTGGPKSVLDLAARARDAQGNAAEAATTLSSEPLGENVLLRLNKAVYKGGEPLAIDVRSSAGLPTVYLDVVKSGQTLLTKWLDVKDGKASYRMDLPASVFGTLEVHAYQVLSSGEIVRDARVVYVNPASDLKIDVKADKETYLPGEKGQIRFQVTDAAGKATPAALGVLVVDEAVYALQEMQPGLEKVYFTLQEELLKPQAQAVFKPSEGLETLVRQPVLANDQQQVAEVLLTAVRPKLPARWEVNPILDRRQKMEGQLAQLAAALFQYGNSGKQVLAQDEKTKVWGFRPGLLDEMVKAKVLDASLLTDPVGGHIDLAGLSRLEKDFTAEHLGQALTQARMPQLAQILANYSNGKRGQWFKDGKWSFPETALADAAKQQKAEEIWLKDAWGQPMKLMPAGAGYVNLLGWEQFNHHELVSAGPDGKFGTADDVKYARMNQWMLAQVWWLGDTDRSVKEQQLQQVFRRNHLRRAGMMEGKGGGGGFGGPFPGAMPPGAPLPPMKADGAPRPELAKMEKRAEADTKGAAPTEGGSAPPTRLREYFPETLLWRPSLITDADGRAVLPLDFADSITTWRLTASASSRGGLLGGVSAPLRVFQDFFVDLDLPVALTQNDEVAFPVAVYNYLKEPQTVKLDLKPEAWFELTDGLGLSRSLDLKPNEVTAVKFRIRAKRIGHFPLTVHARGTKMSDAIKRGIDVQPDGKKIEQVVSDRLAGTVSQNITIPENALPDASKLLVKVYPGVLSQVLEGTEGMLRLPGG
jgi:hypothetical protein